jgi:hypothetical protein
VYLCDLSSNIHGNWSGGNSLVVRDRCVLLGGDCGAVIASKMAICVIEMNWEVVWMGGAVFSILQ